MSVLIGVCRFLAAAYSLYLYVSTQHGHIGAFVNCICSTNKKNLHTDNADIDFYDAGQWDSYEIHDIGKSNFVELNV